MKGNTLAIGLVVLAVVFVVLAGLYYEGVLQIFVSDPQSQHHTSHTILFGVLAIACLIGANFARSKKTA